MQKIICLFAIFTASISAIAQSTPLACRNNPHLSAEARNFFDNGMNPDAAGNLASVTDSLCARVTANRPFYIHLVSNALSRAAGSTAGILNSACRSFAENNPTDLMRFFTSENGLCESRYFYDWADAVAGALMQDDCCNTHRIINASLRSARLACKAHYLPTLNRFYHEVRVKVQERRVLSAVCTIPEVSTALLQGNCTVTVHQCPVADLPYFWVKVQESNHDATLTRFDFTVDPETMEVLFFDPAGHRMMPMEVWREKWQ